MFLFGNDMLLSSADSQRSSFCRLAAIHFRQTRCARLTWRLAALDFGGLAALVFLRLAPFDFRPARCARLFGGSCARLRRTRCARLYGGKLCSSFWRAAALDFGGLAALVFRAARCARLSAGPQRSSFWRPAAIDFGGPAALVFLSAPALDFGRLAAPVVLAARCARPRRARCAPLFGGSLRSSLWRLAALDVRQTRCEVNSGPHVHSTKSSRP